MKHAFLITAYKSPEQLAELVNQLCCAEFNFYIHLDKKSNLKEESVKSLIKQEGNVVFLKNSIDVYWGGFSHLKAFYLLLKKAHENKENSYFHVLSGQCFPIKSNDFILDFFEKNNGKEYIDAQFIDESKWTGGSMNRIQLYHLNDYCNIRADFWKTFNGRFLKVQRIIGIKRKPPTIFEKYYGGSTWWSITRNAVDYILRFVVSNKKVFNRFKHTHCSEELFFQTVLMNSSFKSNIVHDDLRYVDWEYRNGSVPANLDETDFEKLVSSPKLFARKMEYPTSKTLLEKLKGKI